MNRHGAQSTRLASAGLPATQEGVGAALRSAYTTPPRNHLPSDMMALLDRLDRA